MKTYSFLAILLLAAAPDLGAQGAPESRRADSAYARAQNLVSEGQGAQGRALVDSMYRVSAPSSTQRAEALFWRASLAATAADAERDYRAIVVDYATSPRVEDALLRLAQLELARGDRDAALRHLRRLSTEYPNSRYRPRTSYWTARVLFDKNDLPAACTANGEALARVAATDIELKNQIEYQHQRCRGVTVAVATRDSAAAPAVAPVPAAVLAPPPARDVTPSIPPGASIAPAEPPALLGQSFSVQVAATGTRSGAQAIANRLTARGYQARIDGTSAPFRVRIGRYSTRAAATRALNEMKAKGIDGFVAAIKAR